VLSHFDQPRAITDCWLPFGYFKATLGFVAKVIRVLGCSNYFHGVLWRGHRRINARQAVPKVTGITQRKVFGVALSSIPRLAPWRRNKPQDRGV
jgi:hypothetical protein